MPKASKKSVRKSAIPLKLYSIMAASSLLPLLPLTLQLQNHLISGCAQRLIARSIFMR